MILTFRTRSSEPQRARGISPIPCIRFSSGVRVPESRWSMMPKSRALIFPNAKIFISRTDADALELKGANIIRADYTDGPYHNFDRSQKIADS